MVSKSKGLFEAMNNIVMKNHASELEFLRYFYDHVDHALGPASDYIYDYIKQDFKQETGKLLPVEYYDREEENDNG